METVEGVTLNGATLSKYASALSAALLDARSHYDRRRYVELLAEASATILEPFSSAVASQPGRGLEFELQ